MTRKAAYFERRENFKAFAAIISVPLMFALASVFDPGALGQITRTFIAAAAN